MFRARATIAALMTCATIACRDPAPAATAHASAEPAPSVEPVRDASADVVLQAQAVTNDASVDSGSQAATANIALERVAALDANRVLAVGGGALYRLDRDHWHRVDLEGATPRDVVSARGALWILARGTGANAGHALVIRSRDGDELQAVAAPALGVDAEPRALIVVRDGEFYIGGNAPPLVHVIAGAVQPERASDAGVTELRYLPNEESVVAVQRDGRAAISRWGESSTLDLDDYLDTVLDAQGNGYLVHARGQISRGRPGREFQALTTAAPFEPRAAAVIGNGRPLLVGASGPFAVWQHHDWRIVTGAFPRDPLSIIPVDPVLVVGRRGEVVAVDGLTTPRVVVPPANGGRQP